MEKSKREIYRGELLKIQNKKGLTAENVVEEAKNKNNPLHEYFDWNNNLAGEKWRIHQARLLINCIIEPKIDEESNKVYSFEIIEGEYQHIDKIMENEEWRKRIVLQAVGQLNYWKNKYEIYNIKEFIPIMKEISKLPTITKQNAKRRRKATVAA